MDKEELKNVSINLMDSAEAAFLTTIDENGYPNTRAMLNLRNKEQYLSLVNLFKQHQEDMLIYFTTNTSSDKVKQIRENPVVSVYYCIPKQFHGLMLAGNIEIVDNNSIKKRLWQDGWEMYYPKGYNDADHTILRLAPMFAKGWYNSARFEFRL